MRIRHPVVVPLVLGLLLLGSASARAQSSPTGPQTRPPATQPPATQPRPPTTQPRSVPRRPPVPPLRSFVAGLGGFTFGTEPSFGVAGQIGVPVTKSIAIVGEVGYLLDVLPAALADDLDELARQASDLVGEPATLDAKVPALYVLASARWMAPSRGKVRPFVEGGGGVARLSVEFTARIGDQDLSDELQQQAGFESTTRPVVAVGGGVEITLGKRLAASAGYQLLHVFPGEDVADIEGDEVSVNTSKLYGAIVYRF